MTQEVLDLSTLVDRPKVRVVSKVHPQGRLYDMHLPGELSVIEHQTIAARHKDVVKLKDKGPEKLTAKEARLLSSLLNDMLTIVLPDLEGEVADDLNDVQKTQVIERWQNLLEPDKGGGDGGPPPTGAA